MRTIRRLHIADYMYVVCYRYWHPVPSMKFTTTNLLCNLRYIRITCVILFVILNVILRSSQDYSVITKVLRDCLYGKNRPSKVHIAITLNLAKFKFS